MSYSSHHHSFDIKIAAIYGIEKALLIHHFQHWIRLNRFKGKNIKDGTCWSYQTRESIAATFPYFTIDSVRHHLNGLVELEILKVGNFNKSKFDKTLWYAFECERAWGVDDFSIKEFYTKGENPKSQGKSDFSCDVGKTPHRVDENHSGCGENPKPIPDTKKKILKKDKYIREGLAALPSADAQALKEKFHSKILELKPDIMLRTTEKWASEFAKMLRIDKRDLKTIEDVIDCLDLKALTYVQSAKKFRDEFDSLEIKNSLRLKKKLIEGNRIFFLKHKEELKEEFKNFSFNDSEVIETKTGKRIGFSLSYREFAQELANLIGGTIHE